MKKALVITYPFPPSGYVGSLRILKFCKYLPTFGWQPVVLTINYHESDYRDDNLLKQIPKETIVCRTMDLDPAKWRRKKSKNHLEPVNIVNRRTHFALRKQNIMGRLKSFISEFLVTPDSHILWIPFALIKGVYIVLKHRVDVVFCSSPPHSSHIIALLLSKLFRKPYVADFRDPWTAYSAKRPHSKSLLELERYLERKVLGRASRVVTVSEGYRREISKSADGTSKNKIEVINNGFDSEDFKIRSASVPKFSVDATRIIITHTGTLYPAVAEEFFSKIAVSVARNKELSGKLEIRFLGDVPEEYVKQIETGEFCSFMKYLGYRKYSQTLKHMLASDALLLLMGGNQVDGWLPVKMFEYMYTQKPILAVTRENEASSIIRESTLGTIIDPNDEKGFLDAIQKLSEEKSEKGYLSRNSNADYISRFERKNAARALARIFEEVIDVRT